MRAVRYHEFGGPEMLRVEEVEPLEPRADEVWVRVAAAGVNPCDALRREGLWGNDLPLSPARTSRARWRRSATRTARSPSATACSAPCRC